MPKHTKLFIIVNKGGVLYCNIGCFFYFFKIIFISTK